jgi:hypothetical protein
MGLFKTKGTIPRDDRGIPPFKKTKGWATQPLGLYNGKPWFLPFAGAWYKFLDWVS